MTMSVWGIFLRSTITVARIYVDAAEAAEGRPRRHKEEEEESHRGHPRPYKLGAGVHLSSSPNLRSKTPFCLTNSSKVVDLGSRHVCLRIACGLG